MKFVVFLAVFATVSIYTVYGLGCYQCKDCEDLTDQKTSSCSEEYFSDSTGEGDKTTKNPEETTTNTEVGESEDPKSSSTTVQPEAKFSCFNITTKDDKPKVFRGCTKLNCKEIQATNNTIKDCFTCSDKDGCNPATNIQSWLLSSLFLLAASLILLH